MNARQILAASPVMPVIVIEQLERAVPLARALVEGGIRVLEVTLRTPVALAAIHAIAAELPEAIVGAGTITRPEELRAARAAGARFGVSPGATPALLAAARDAAWPFLPGVMTPSEVMAARDAGFDTLKLFPAQQAGGLGMLKALAGPLPDLCFCPTGGISLETAPEFLALPNVGCVGGSWLAPADLVARADWDGIRRLARAAAALRPPSA
ncbi:MAG: bifunctional 4-hydroxy-2-oxoglutarate aldolase/2-dehydro-3-deoxy-phosphogluconate aldolase [Rhodocyclaceae bacterium]|nr:bifunctional 4-hydroxy-2-oxoglutarate aldolase/2-dehydro-3-deoxy-phosphogluconate aldolase [Rhodocyclaceae bacterium]